MAETLSGYMGGRYAAINNTLRGLSLGGTKSDRVAAYSATLFDLAPMEAELRKRAPVEAGKVVYRRCGPLADYNTGLGSPYQTGETFRDAAFLSTSRTPRSWQGQNQLMMVITCAKSSRGHDVLSVRRIAGEAEILFERGTRFLIKNQQAAGNNNTIWRMTELTGT